MGLLYDWLMIKHNGVNYLLTQALKGIVFILKALISDFRDWKTWFPSVPVGRATPQRGADRQE